MADNDVNFTVYSCTGWSHYHFTTRAQLVTIVPGCLNTQQFSYFQLSLKLLVEQVLARHVQ